MRFQPFVLCVLIITAACKPAKQPTACIDQSKVNPDAVCYQIYKPVCGCDNKTYSNDCVAQNSGVTSWKEGECPEK